MITERMNPEVLMKCIKNDTEINNTKKAHLKDAVAHTKFMFWLKHAAGSDDIVTEISASDKLESSGHSRKVIWAPALRRSAHSANMEPSSITVQRRNPALRFTKAGCC